MNILFITPYLPFIPDTGGAIRRKGFLEHLSKEHNVTVVGYYYTESQKNYLYLVEKICNKLYAIQFDPCKQLLPATWCGKDIPDISKECVDLGIRDSVAELFHFNRYDIIHLEHSYFAIALPNNIPQERVCIDEHNIESEIYQRQLALSDEILEVDKLKVYHNWQVTNSFEENVWKLYPRCIVTSYRESDIIRNRVPNTNVVVVPNSVDVDYFYFSDHQFIERNRIAFVGSLNHIPNLDGIKHFLKNIFPMILQGKPDTMLYIIGGPIRDDIKSCISELGQKNNVVLTGYIKDIRPILSGSRLAIAPIRYGSGTRLKIISAMSMGVPVVTTSTGVEGIDLIHGEDILISDDAEHFAERVLSLLQDDTLWLKLRVNGRNHVVESYSYSAMGTQIDKAYRSLFNFY